MGRLVKLAWIIATLGVVTPVLALDTSIGEEGIFADRLQNEPLNLTGRKIAIGQVEIGRPIRYGLDKVAAWKPPYILSGLFYRNELAKANTYVDNHASMVAGVMVSQDKRFKGVAPDARLYSGAVGSLKKGGQPEECLTSQHIALQNSGDVRAINFSFGESLQRDPRENAKLDGNALLTQCIDWSSRVHDVLYVIAGNQGKGGIPIPTDHYNGITAAYTAKRQGQYKKIDFANLSGLPVGIGSSLIKKEINQGSRRAVSLVAPGNKISTYDMKGKIVEVSGTSFAAPHITATVALLQEYGDRQIRQDPSNWNIDARRHEVMKAILLNSADKILDPGNGLLLGMNRTTLNKHNQTWFDSDAYSNPKIPLDIQMGSGHLNAWRAYQQYSAHQQSPDTPVSPIGWDYRTVEMNGYRDYILEQPLLEQSFVSITLAWDRVVELNDSNQNQRYDIGETFRDRGLNNLDVYLMSADQDNNTKYTCASISDADSIEHIFCPVPKTGNYKIRVQYRQRINNADQSYALAWWTVPASK
ncbi:peptidase S8 and S53 subtilisin kexin sedolisin [Aphanothece hegewaldii CCALA 016]|uniref:Peptidase S8 and S53 subtilisin kexin sedolisin n=1 Tax=Aphanothece hegewaldii CCALA 016 TaxID=2107694 RepID=A0A2T1LYE5_9CHRO|nr:S8 family serine peptidase [Aphanothece hegewaldii]PSF37417.1 peptidase S8 and S53 subtilisin kexin sedolisin [Aphanothece hegewaldii CCALA 016]